MPFRTPNLDDRRFADLVEEARRRIVQMCPDWTDLSPSDPGMMLVEVFAHLTEIMIYRLNRVTEKSYIEFLRLIGVQLQAPAAAAVDLRFTLARAQERAIGIPRGSRVAAARAGGSGESPIFVTAETVTIAAGVSEVDVRAYHAEMVIAEHAGTGTGLPGLSVRASRPPIIAPIGDNLDLIVGVEAAADEIDVGVPSVQHQGKSYRIWREVENFTNLGNERFVYLVDRLSGIVTFAPAVRMKGEGESLQDVPQALAEVPRLGREIRLWYLRGGGLTGNVAANSLTTLKDPIPGIKVTNLNPAVGGRAAETLENALIRGPQDMHSLRRAVTARDFELVAVKSSGAVNRAKAYTRAMLWAHARAGTVEVLLVPNLPEEVSAQGRVTVEQLQQHETEAARQQIQKAFDNRRPLCIHCVVNWARCKTVCVEARVVTYREEDPARVKMGVLERLYKTINPLVIPPEVSGWPFGQALRVSDIYKIVGTYPGVRSVDKVRLVIDEVPYKDVKALAADVYQPHAWYAATKDTVYRSTNDAEGWERIARFAGEEVELVKNYPREIGIQRDRPGLVAVATRLADDSGSSKVHISRDCGETWESGLQTNFQIDDMAWADREGVLLLFLATEKGLYELSVSGEGGTGPQPVLVDPKNQALGFYAVAVSYDVSQGMAVAVAGRDNQGVFISSDGGRSKSFRSIGLGGELVRILAVQPVGPHRYLWAGIAAPGTDPGKGCFRWRITGSVENVEDWRPYNKGWQAGSCYSLAFHESKVFAASFRAGVLQLDANFREPTWESPGVKCGLPIRDVGRFQPVEAVAADHGGLLLAGGIEGVFRSNDQGGAYQCCSLREFLDAVTLPSTWLWCSGEHKITVVSEDEEQRD